MDTNHTVQYLRVWDDGCAVNWKTLARCDNLQDAPSVYSAIVCHGHIWLDGEYEPEAVNVLTGYEESFDSGVILRIIDSEYNLVRSTSQKNYSVNAHHSLYMGLRT